MFWMSFHRVHWTTVTIFWIFFLFVFFTSFIPMYLAEKVVPGSSRYGFPIKFLNDHFQYVVMIKNGREGDLRFRNPYTEEPDFPPIIMQPFYNVIGLFSRPFNFSLFQIMEVSRLVSVAVFLFAVLCLVSLVSNSTIVRNLSFIFFVVSTNTWWIVRKGSVNLIGEPETYSNWFQVYQKLTMLPPHHYISVILMFFIFIAIAGFRKNLTYRRVLGCLFLSFFLGFLHPYTAVATGYIVGIFVILSFFVERNNIKKYIVGLFAVGMGVVPGVVYNLYLLKVIWKSATTQVNTLSWSPPLISFQTYILALGPLIILAVLSLFDKNTWIHPLKRIVVLWLVIPTVVFFLPNIGVPTGGIRLFQTYQHIPLAVLAAIGIHGVISKITKINLKVLVTCIVTIIVIAYSIPPYFFSVQSHVNTTNNYFYVVKIIEASRETMEYLEKNSEKDSVVMTGEILGSFLPIFTHNKVIIGHDGNNRNYVKKRKEIQSFLGGFVPIGEVETYLRRYQVKYIVFGLDAMNFSETPYSKLPFFELVFSGGGAQIFKINLP